MGMMSLRCVRAAQLGLILSFLSAISRASRSTPAACVPPAPGKPMSAVSICESFHQVKQLEFLFDWRARETEGDCKPSRKVSSSMPMWRLGAERDGSTVFQS